MYVVKRLNRKAHKTQCLFIFIVATWWFVVTRQRIYLFLSCVPVCLQEVPYDHYPSYIGLHHTGTPQTCLNYSTRASLYSYPLSPTPALSTLHIEPSVRVTSGRL